MNEVGHPDACVLSAGMFIISGTECGGIGSVTELATTQKSTKRLIILQPD